MSLEIQVAVTDGNGVSVGVFHGVIIKEKYGEWRILNEGMVGKQVSGEQAISNQKTGIRRAGIRKLHTTPAGCSPNLIRRK
jgi:hypothetical protein